LYRKRRMACRRSESEIEEIFVFNLFCLTCLFPHSMIRGVADRADSPEPSVDIP
jgi:hypothetical protein